MKERVRRKRMQTGYSDSFDQKNQSISKEDPLSDEDGKENFDRDWSAHI